MAKVKTVHICSDCGWESPKWQGQCRACGEWGTLTEFTDRPGKPGSAAASVRGSKAQAVPVTQVDVEEAAAFPSGVGEFDRVLGRGITPGGVVLLAGDPGVGKSTLLLDIAARYARMAAAGGRGPVLYGTGEETVSQVKLRAERIEALTPDLLLVAANDIDTVAALVTEHHPSLVVVDSVQTFVAPEVEGVQGGVTQIRAVTNAVIRMAKENNIPAILVGHVTKEGALAGPRTLEHMVDVVCHIEGEKNTGLRLLRSLKNRYGSTEEVGCFQLTSRGIEEVPDPSALFVSRRADLTPGSAVGVMLDGQRAIPTEVQALIEESQGGSGRRVVSGLSHSRVTMLLAVLGETVGKSLSASNVYVSTVGGASTVDPALDLAVVLAAHSAAGAGAVGMNTVAIGEVGLTGDVRACHGMDRRLLEAERLGFRRALIPASQADQIRSLRRLELVPVSSVLEALQKGLPSD